MSFLSQRMIQFLKCIMLVLSWCTTGRMASGFLCQKPARQRQRQLNRPTIAMLRRAVLSRRHWPSSPAMTVIVDPDPWWLSHHGRQVALALTAVEATSISNDNENFKDPYRSHHRDKTLGSITLRDRLRNWTGFSLTALRKAMRTATGISITAVYASTVAVTGTWIRQTMKWILSIFPAWFRYFLQPFLILYYAPLFILRSVTGPTRERARQTHDHFVEGWREAIEKADNVSTYWPIHLTADGRIEKDFDEVDLNDAVAESMELVMDEKSILKPIISSPSAS